MATITARAAADCALRSVAVQSKADRHNAGALRQVPVSGKASLVKKGLALQARSGAGAKTLSSRHQERGRGVRAEASSGVISEAAPAQLKDVLIESEAGVSYDVLQDRLARGQWEEADKETRRLLCVLAGEGAAKRKWIYFTEVKSIPEKDLKTLDRLWRSYSDDKFGFSVQRRIWNALDRRWKPFFLKIGWTFGENSNYKKFPMDFAWEIEAPVGHLPLTNCLRGTQLFENLLLHPAFASFDAEQIMPDDSKLPDYGSKEAAEQNGVVANGSASAPAAPSLKPNLTGSIFDEDFNSSDFGF